MNSLKHRKQQLKHLRFILKLKESDELENIITNVDSYYGEFVEEKKDKNTGLAKRYKDGSVKRRILNPPFNSLKNIQSKIKNKILSKIPLPENIHGAVKKKSNITNAKYHQGNKYIFTTDLVDFFPSITIKDVNSIFSGLGYSCLMARFLSLLTTYKKRVPQGAPTSSHLANLAFLNIDKTIIDFCYKKGIKYTRYVDDLTFSAPFDFKDDILSIIKIIKCPSHNFKINYRKTNYKGNQIITGIQLSNNCLGVPDKIKIKVEEEKKLGLQNGPYTNYANQIISTNKRKK
ncbi:MAG TPA: reverse transcriptase family protein [Cytophagaceae bacterium]|jgi:RNA-directed DNA polymerase